MLTRERKEGILQNLDHCILFSSSIVGNGKATNGDRVIAALTIAIASIGSAYVQKQDIDMIMTAGRN